MSVRSGQSITKMFPTRRFDTGAATNADTLPTGTLYVNGTVNAAAVTVTNVATGLYSAQVTLPTLAVGDVVDLVIQATVNSVTDNAVIWWDSKDVLLDTAGGVDVTQVQGVAAPTPILGRYPSLPDAGSGVTGSGNTTMSINVGSGRGVNSTVGLGLLCQMPSTGNLEVRLVTAYDNTTGLATVDRAYSAAPSTGAAWVLTPAASADVASVNRVSATAVTTISAFIGSTGASVNGTNANTLSGHDPGTTLASHADASALSTQIGSPQQVGTKYAVTLASTDVTGNLPANVVALNSNTTIGGKDIYHALWYLCTVGAGQLPSGAGSGTEVWKDFGGTTAVTFTVDASGNRTGVYA